jgi:hypothetical protein
MFLIQWFQPFPLTDAFLKFYMSNQIRGLLLRTYFPICIPKTKHFYFSGCIKKPLKRLGWFSWFPLPTIKIVGSIRINFTATLPRYFLPWQGKKYLNVLLNPNLD